VLVPVPPNTPVGVACSARGAGYTSHGQNIEPSAAPIMHTQASVASQTATQGLGWGDKEENEVCKIVSPCVDDINAAVMDQIRQEAHNMSNHSSSVTTTDDALLRELEYDLQGMTTLQMQLNSSAKTISMLHRIHQAYGDEGSNTQLRATMTEHLELLERAMLVMGKGTSLVTNFPQSDAAHISSVTACWKSKATAPTLTKESKIAMLKNLQSNATASAVQGKDKMQQILNPLCELSTLDTNETDTLENEFLSGDPDVMSSQIQLLVERQDYAEPFYLAKVQEETQALVNWLRHSRDSSELTT
jgi:hypothetical protein